MNNNYYNFEFDDSRTTDDVVGFYESLPTNELIKMLNSMLDDIDFDINYYAKFLDNLFQGIDYNEHYYRLICLSEDINSIKIILTILKGKDNGKE